MSKYPESALREPDDLQRPLTTREMELEIQLTRAEAEAERVKAEAERTKIAAVGEALKQFVEQPGPKVALEGFGATLHAHEQLMQDKRDAEAQRQRE
jgi:regulator of protease activity HflC (stomatin/prohibitin superfamily)